MIEIHEASEADYPEIQRLIHATVDVCYPAIYAPEIIRFYHQYHSLNEIKRRASEGVFLILRHDGLMKATGFLTGEEMGGLYVHPDYQRQGLGTAIIRQLLEIAVKQNLSRIWLDATPYAKPLYEKLGFRVTRTAVMYIENNPLDYFKMERILP